MSKLISEEEKYRGPRFNVTQKIYLRDDGTKIVRDIVNPGEAAVILPITDNPAVTFNESPTVPNADTTSKNMSINVNVLNAAISDIYISSWSDISDINNPIIAAITTKILIENITIALFTISNDIVFLCSSSH